VDALERALLELSSAAHGRRERSLREYLLPRPRPLNGSPS
jgi:hypothetical protein